MKLEGGRNHESSRICGRGIVPYPNKSKTRKRVLLFPKGIKRLSQTREWGYLTSKQK